MQGNPLFEAVRELRSGKLIYLVVDYMFEPSTKTVDEVVNIVGQAYSPGPLAGEFLEGERLVVLDTLGHIATGNREVWVEFLRAVPYGSVDFDYLCTVSPLTTAELAREFTDAVV